MGRMVACRSYQKLPTTTSHKKEPEYETRTQRERETDSTLTRTKEVNIRTKTKIYRRTLEERTHSMSATKRKQPLEKKRMVPSINER